MDFRDCRSMKVIFVPHCALNQNARSPTTATSPAGATGFIAGLFERGIGIVQLPCPELMIIKLGRGGIKIRSALDTIPARAACRKMSKDLVYQIKQYLDCGVEVLGIFGKDDSPSCGVETTCYDGEHGQGVGLFIQELQAELAQQDLTVPIAELKDNENQVNLAVVDRWSGSG